MALRCPYIFGKTMRNDYLDYLMHHGVVGMKWGVRKKRGTVEFAYIDKTKIPKQKTYNKPSSIKTLDNKNRLSGTVKKDKKASDATKNAKSNAKMSDTIKKMMEKLQKSKTPEEKEEAKKEVQENAKKTTEKGRSWFEQSLKAGKDKPKISAAEKVTQTSEKGVSDLVKLRNLRDTHKNNKSAAKSLSEISTEDLRKIVAGAKERSALEDDYRKYVANSVSSGRKRTTETLETLGAMLAVAGSAVTIVSTIKSFKNGKKDDE